MSALKSLVISRGERHVYNRNETMRKDHVQRYILSSISATVLIFSILGCILSEITALKVSPSQIVIREILRFARESVITICDGGIRVSN